MTDLLVLWSSTKDTLPDSERQVLCITRTKRGTYNYVLGYYSPELERWCCGMNSNVVAWMELPVPAGIIGLL